MNIKLSDNFNYAKLIKFTIPTIFMMIITSIYGVVDGLFISNEVGSDAFAAVNLVMPVVMIGSSIGFMFGAGGGALVSKTLGEGNDKRANEIFSMLVYLLIILGVIITIVGVTFIKPIAIALGANDAILDNCVVYGRTLFMGATPYLLQNCFQSFLVVAEKPKMGLVVSISAGLTNIILDYLLIYVFKMGVFGAALATATSQLVGGVIPLIYFIRKNNSKLKLIKTKFDISPIMQSSLNGSSEMFTYLSMAIMHMLYNLQLIKLAGNNGVVAYGVIMYITFIFSGIYNGYSVGITPVVGYHYGADNREELQSILKKSFILISVTALALTSIAELFSGTLAKIFVNYNNDLLVMTTNAIRIFSLSYIISGFNIFSSAFFTGLNNGVVSGTISFLRTFVFQVIMIFLLPIFWGLNGIWSAVVVAEILSLTVSIGFFIINNPKYEYASFSYLSKNIK